jgi:CheY-like chemotaxis protein
LAIVKRLSVLLEHPVHVQSELCNGSIFSIQVPRGGTSDIYCPVAEAAIGSRQHGQFAVLVDDDASVLTGLQMLLQTWGYEVLTAASTSQALERLATTGKLPDVVVADYRLREGQVGTDTVMQIRAQLGRPVPGIILTGELGGEWQAGAKVNGLEVVFKPVTPRQLYDALEQCIRSNAL